MAWWASPGCSRSTDLSILRLNASLPLAVDQPRDIGDDDLWAHCRICETNCPPQALFPEKQLVHGERRWYVTFDKCVPYFAETRGCGICIEVCPWSTPRKGPVEPPGTDVCHVGCRCREPV